VDCSSYVADRDALRTSDCPAPVTPVDYAQFGKSLGGWASNGIRIMGQLSQDGQSYSEDRLSLNIWTKPQTGESKKAVLFWIYGGGKITIKSDVLAKLMPEARFHYRQHRRSLD
jgi:hypothetical protein